MRGLTDSVGMAGTLSHETLSEAGHLRPSVRLAGRLAALLLAALIAFGAVACSEAGNDEPDPSAAAASASKPFAWPGGPHSVARLEVAGFGEIEIELYPELAPGTVANFEKLASEGFYDGTSFHRVIPGFMVQGGDPNTRDANPQNDGRGGPGYAIDDELSDAPHERGVLSMANTGRPNTGGSQFFIMHGDAPHLDGRHTVFGRVRSGLDVVDAVAAVEIDEHGRFGPKQRPIEPVVLERVTIERPPTTTTEGDLQAEPRADARRESASRASDASDRSARRCAAGGREQRA